MSSVMDKPNAAVEKFLAGLTAGEARLPVDWEQWLQIGAPYAETGVTRKEVTTRFARNGYDWDNLPAYDNEVFAVLESSNPETDDEGEEMDDEEMEMSAKQRGK